MAPTIVGLFFVAHGLVHFTVWVPGYKKAVPFDPSRSWILGSLGVSEGSMRSIAVALAAIDGIGFILAGLGWLLADGWGKTLAVGSAAASALLVVLYFNPWLSFAFLINVAILYALLR